MNKVRIFGYGSLINEESMRTSSPHATDFRPAYIRDFRRSFSKWDDVGFTESNLDVSGIAHCALDVQPYDGGYVNGVVFTVDESEFQKLIKREHGYNVLETAAYDFVDDAELGTAYVFSAKQPSGSFNFGNIAQERYLQICLEGAITFGKEYYQQFIETTYNVDTALHNSSDFTALLQQGNDQLNYNN